MAAKKVAVAVAAVQRTKVSAPQAPLPEGAKAPGEKVEQRKVEGKAVKLVMLDYKKDNTHLLHHVHAISQGLNSIPEDVWAEAKKAPANKALLDAGHLVEVKQAEVVAESEAPAPKGAKVKVAAEKEEKAAG